jgi:hypothetical protein
VKAPLAGKREPGEINIAFGEIVFLIIKKNDMRIIRFIITSVGLCLFLAGCGGNIEEPPLPPPVDTVVVEPTDTIPIEVKLEITWSKLYPMDSMSPLLRPWVGRWAWFKGIDERDTVYEIDPSSSETIWEFFPDGRVYDGTCKRESLYALDSLYLYIKTKSSSLESYKYSFLEDSSILRLDLFHGWIVFNTMITDYYKHIKD